jgi:radical SAM-linked protein
MQRLRIKFARGEEIKFISHLDVMRLWFRAFRRAGIPLAYSEGFNPHPKMSLAVPLAVGVTSEAELMDVVLTKVVSPHWFIQAVNQQLPAGITILGVFQISPLLPSLQSQVRFAEYRVRLEAAESEKKDVESAITHVLSADQIPWRHLRDTGERTYDLRALIDDLELTDSDSSGFTLNMRLRCDSGGSGRPEQVVLALGYKRQPQSVHRTRLVLEVS